LAKKSTEKNSNKQKQKTIRDLKRENRKLRRENDYLRHLAEQYDPPVEVEDAPEQVALTKAVKRTHTLRSKTYFAYLFQRFRQTRPFQLFNKTRFAMKSVRMARKTLVFLAGFSTFLGISAQFLLIAGAVAVFMPAALIASAVIGVYSFFSHRKRNKTFKPLFSRDYEGKIYFVFLPKNKSCDYFVRTLSDLTEKGYVFLVSPSLGDCKRKSILPMGERMFKMHISAYFSFVRKVSADKTVKIYL
jgi:hypothetical protein